MIKLLVEVTYLSAKKCHHYENIHFPELWPPLSCIDFLKGCLMGKEIILVAEESEIQGPGGDVPSAAHTWVLRLPLVHRGKSHRGKSLSPFPRNPTGFPGNLLSVRLVILQTSSNQGRQAVQRLLKHQGHQRNQEIN